SRDRRQFRQLWPGAGHHHACIGDGSAHQCKCAERRWYVIDRFKVPRNDYKGTARWWCRALRTEPLQVDDIGHDRTFHAVSVKNLTEKSGWHYHDACAAHRSPYKRARSGKKRFGFAAPIIHDDRDTAKPTDPYRRRGEQMPRPTGVGHNMEYLHPASCSPQRGKIRKKTTSRTNAKDVGDPGRSVRSIHLYHKNGSALALQELC